MKQIDNTIVAEEGKTFKRIHDGAIMGNTIQLDKDYSTGIERDDKPEYYEEVVDENYTKKEEKSEPKRVEKTRNLRDIFAHK